MVATKNIDILGPIWTFSLRDVLTFVTSGLDVNGCVLSYFEGTANLHFIQAVFFFFFKQDWEYTYTCGTVVSIHH